MSGSAIRRCAPGSLAALSRASWRRYLERCQSSDGASGPTRGGRRLCLSGESGEMPRLAADAREHRVPAPDREARALLLTTKQRCDRGRAACAFVRPRRGRALKLRSRDGPGRAAPRRRGAVRTSLVEHSARHAACAARPRLPRCPARPAPRRSPPARRGARPRRRSRPAAVARADYRRLVDDSASDCHRFTGLDHGVALPARTRRDAIEAPAAPAFRRRRHRFVGAWSALRPGPLSGGTGFALGRDVASTGP